MTGVSRSKKIWCFPLGGSPCVYECVRGQRNLLFKPIEDRLELLEIVNKTTEKISKRDLENDKTIKGEVYKVLKDMMESENEEKSQAARLALRLVFAALRNEDPEDILETETDDL